MRTASLIARQSFLGVIEQKTVVLFGLLFVGLVVLSAYLGWSATATVNAIYQDAVTYLQAQGVSPLPDNPVHQTSPLGLLRNMTIYISLIGVLCAIIIGHQLISLDRRSGTLPLIGSRLISPVQFFWGKFCALNLLLGPIMLITAGVAAAALALLPEISLTAQHWYRLGLFTLISYLYLLFYGTLSFSLSATCKRESVALLVPVTIWLALTFIFPSLTHNIHPTAAINPVSSLASAPEGKFFEIANQLLSHLSIAEQYKTASAYFLEYQIDGSPKPTSQILALLLITLATVLLSLESILTLNFSRSEYND